MLFIQNRQSSTDNNAVDCITSHQQHTRFSTDSNNKLLHHCWLLPSSHQHHFAFHRCEITTSTSHQHNNKFSISVDNNITRYRQVTHQQQQPQLTKESDNRDRSYHRFIDTNYNGHQRHLIFINITSTITTSHHRFSLSKFIEITVYSSPIPN